MCSTSNPVENVFCSKCGARLIPHGGGLGAERTDSAPPIRGLSLPAKPASQPVSPTEEEIKAPQQEIKQELNATEDQTEDVPITREKIEDWLTKLRESPPVEDETGPLPAKPPAISPAPSTTFPDWVQQVQPPEKQTPTLPSKAVESPLNRDETLTPGVTGATSPAPSPEIPDWLRERDAVTQAPELTTRIEEKKASQPFETPMEELPSWLRVATEETFKPVEPPQAAIQEEHKEELPIQPPSFGPAEPETVEPEPIEPAWAEEDSSPVSEFKPFEEWPVAPPQTLGVEAEVEPEPIETAHADEIPAWIASLKPAESETPPSPTIKVEAEPELEQIEPARAEEIPPWIAELKPSKGETPSSPASTFEAGLEPESIEPARAEEIPSWIAELKPAEDEAAPPTPEFDAEVHTEELADWLRAPKLEPSLPIAPLEFLGEPAEMSGPLANLRGILPLATAMTEPHPATQAAPAEKKDGAHLFEEILAEPLVQTPRPARRRMRSSLMTMRPVIYLALAFAVILALFIPPGFSGALLAISGTPAAEFYDAIETLPSNSTVLISFDYDASLSGEMDLVAAAILRHLIQRRINIIALSTLDTGPFIAQRVLAAAEASAYRYGTNFLNAGLVPGHESGLAQLATQGFQSDARDFEQNQLISQYPIAANVKNIKSVSLVIELAGGEETLKSWLEQFATQVNVRMAAGASAAVEPKARAYRDAGQLTALVSGPVGAAQYEILTKQPGEAVRRATAQSVAQIVLIMTVLAGNAALLISRAMEKK